jgi:hypothetical protein
MKQLSILITLLISLGFSSACWGKKFNFLQVKDYKNVLLVADVAGENVLGINRSNVLLATKLMFLKNGLKVFSAQEAVDQEIDIKAITGVEIVTRNIEIGDKAFGCAVHINIQMSKLASEYGLDSNVIGGTFNESRTRVSRLIIVSEYKHFEYALESVVKEFILNYLESNME